MRSDLLPIAISEVHGIYAYNISSRLQSKDRVLFTVFSFLTNRNTSFVSTARQEGTASTYQREYSSFSGNRVTYWSLVSADFGVDGLGNCGAHIYPAENTIDKRHFVRRCKKRHENKTPPTPATNGCRCGGGGKGRPSESSYGLPRLEQ